mgnify:CR=1 FL=1
MAVIAESEAEVQGVDPALVRRKVAWRLLPLIFLLYIVSYLDRANVGFAKLAMKDDLKFSDEVFGTGFGIFFIGGILTTVGPPLIDKTWAKPFSNSDPSKGPTGQLKPYTEQELKGRAIYVREGCTYCHTQQTRTLLADTKRSG